MTAQTSTPHDEFFKEIFGEVEYARDLLRGILPTTLQEHLDLEHLTRESESFVTEQLSEEFADLVFTCPMSEGTAMVALLLEHKSWAPRHPHLQLLRYMQGIWERADKAGQALCPVIPVVLYHGQGEWKVREFAESFPGYPDRLRAFLPEFRFLLLDLAREPLEPLRGRFGIPPVRSAIELMRAIFTPSEVRAFLERLRPEDGPMDPDRAQRYLRVVMRYIFKRSDTNVREALTYALHPATREVTVTWEEQLLERGEQRGLAKGIEQGIEQGIERGLRAKAIEDARKLVEHGVSWEIITSATGIKPEDLAAEG